MNTLERVTPLIGRVLLATIFIYSGFGKITGFEATAGYMAAYGMPMTKLLLVGAIALELGGGLSILTGYKARWGAAALVLFTIPATFIFHAFWTISDPGQAFVEELMFLKNLAIVGGLLLLMTFGPGRLALGARAA